MTKNKKIIISIVAVLAIAAAGIGTYYITNKDNTVDNNTVTESEEQLQEEEQPVIDEQPEEEEQPQEEEQPKQEEQFQEEQQPVDNEIEETENEQTIQEVVQEMQQPVVPQEPEQPKKPEPTPTPTPKPQTPSREPQVFKQDEPPLNPIKGDIWKESDGAEAEWNGRRWSPLNDIGYGSTTEDDGFIPGGDGEHFGNFG